MPSTPASPPSPGESCTDPMGEHPSARQLPASPCMSLCGPGQRAWARLSLLSCSQPEGQMPGTCCTPRAASLLLSGEEPPHRSVRCYLSHSSVLSVSPQSSCLYVPTPGVIISGPPASESACKLHIPETYHQPHLAPEWQTRP